jgi:benzoate membrane transport protein
MKEGELRRTLPALSGALTMTLVFVAVLGLVLAAARGLELSRAQTATWIAVLYGLPGLVGLGLTLRYRQPMLLTGNVFAIIFIASLGDRIEFADLAGASLVAGAIVLAAAAFGVTGRLAAWVPAPVVHGLIAGAVIPFVSDIFTGLSTSNEQGVLAPRVPIMVGSALVAYLVGQRFLAPRVPPIFPALVAGLAVAGFTGQFGSTPQSLALLKIDIVRPSFDTAALVTATPVLIALIAFQANLPSIIYMRAQGFDPPERAINLWSGLGTVAGSFLGPVAVSLALPAMPLTAGPTAGERSIRHRSAYACAAVLVLISVLAGTAADLAVLVPPVLLLALAGLALVGALVGALKEVVRGPLVLGPIFAFTIALSDISLLSLGPFFWALVLGTAVSLMLERDEWKQLPSGRDDD